MACKVCQNASKRAVQRNRELRELRRSVHLCTRCGSDKLVPPFKKCEMCRKWLVAADKRRKNR